MKDWSDGLPDIVSDSARRRRYRNLQSWWRQEQLGARPGPSGSYTEVGSMLHSEDLEAQPDLNFLHPAAYEHALERVAAVKEVGGTLEAQRLWANLLSSMPLCFNLFGSLRAYPQRLQVVQACFDADAEEVDPPICEWPSSDLDDKTAFDAYLPYRLASGRRCFIGIETKYTESFSPRKYPPERYEQAAGRGWFTDPSAALARLTASMTNQVFRQVLLAAAVEHRTGERGRAAVVCLADDARAAAVVDKVRSELADPERLKLVTLESIIGASEMIGAPISTWASRFALRYLNPGAERTPEPLGPRLGRVLTRPEASA